MLIGCGLHGDGTQSVHADCMVMASLRSSGEIERALRDLHIVSDTSQPGVPQNNAVVERLVQDILEGTRTALLRAGLPAMFLGIRLPTLLFDGKRSAWPGAGCG